MTVVCPVHRWGPLQLGLVFSVIHLVPALLRKLRRLSFIDYAGWGVTDPLPWGGPVPGARRQANTLVFISNFDGGRDEYLAEFAEALRVRLGLVWLSSVGFPGPFRLTPFQRSATMYDYGADHYYAARPTATATDITRALELERSLLTFRAEAAAVDADAFPERFHRFLSEVQRLL